ncbi:MAG: DUF357 domain-containing protein [Sulfolobales archaeon]
MGEEISRNPRERLRRYLIKMRKVLEEAERNFSGDLNARKVLEEARRYYEDARYYLDKEDYETGLVAVSYAEGLLDALRMLGYTSFEWSRPADEKIVFVGGTFDIVHPGHIALLKKASEYGKVYVSVARDANVVRFKGREPVNPESWRLEVVSAIRYVYKAFLGDEGDVLKSVERVRPDIILLGPDQVFNEEDLVRELRNRNLGDITIIRMPTRIDNYSTTGVIRRILDRYCLDRF